MVKSRSRREWGCLCEEVQVYGLHAAPPAVRGDQGRQAPLRHPGREAGPNVLPVLLQRYS